VARSPLTSEAIFSDASALFSIAAVFFSITPFNI
jgi:hypothetical protein